MNCTQNWCEVYFATFKITEKGQGMSKDGEKKPRSCRKSKAPEPELSGIDVTPIQLLGLILKAVLKDRITDQEVEIICSNYYKTVKDIWG